MTYPRSRRSPTGTRAERRTAARLGAELTPASGALDGAKGDMSTDAFLVENKATERDSLSLPLDWLAKIAIEARERGLNPALALQFVTADGRPRENGAWVVIPEHVYRELTDE